MQTRLEEIDQILDNERDWNKIDSHSLIMERSEIEFKRNSKNINFSMRSRSNGCNKHYYAFQCYEFTQNLLKYGYDKYITKEEIKEKGICFNKYSINVGYSQYCKDLKRFDSKEEMFGFVIGYNEAVKEAKDLQKILDKTA
tara:strand:+ start:62 stop:484 length:423 start_codon:yes stop_codon:yes gene_type:complete